MPFLTVNGFTVQVFDGSHEKQPIRRGGRRRSFRSQMRDGRRGVRNRHEFRTCFMDFDDAETFINVVNGLGHLIYFRDGFQATSGLMPVVNQLSSVRFDFTQVPFAGFPNGSLYGDSGSDCQFSYDAQLRDDDWTIFWMEYDVNEPGYVFQTSRSDLAHWRDGVRTDAQFGGGVEWKLKVVAGHVHLSTVGADSGQLHHMAFLPYRASDRFIETWHALTQPWGPTPSLRVTGDVLRTDRELFFGEVTGVDIIQKPTAIPGIGWVNNSKVISFALDEIADGFVADPKVEQGSVL